MPSSAVASFLDRDRISEILAPWVPDGEDRRFVVRCLLDEGPAHHRGANYVLLSLLGELAGKTGAAATAAARDGVAVPMRLPPHLRKERDDEEEDESAFPLRFPKAPLRRLAKEGTPAFEAMVDCLTDGPPQHALANAAMMCLIAALLEERGGAERRAGSPPEGRTADQGRIDRKGGG